jgi:VWFA-related protein
MRDRVARVISVLLAVCILLDAAAAQQQPSQSLPMFRAETRQVLVDVVVTDHGHFVAGLKPADFNVMEDGKPQKIVAFGMHASSTVPRKPAPPVKLPPNQYTNYAIADPQRPITIVLMDVLNTQVQDQAYTRKQMIEFLKSLPSGERVALFVLGTRLRMIQPFTGESDTLVAAAKMLLRQSSPLMTSEQQRQDDEVVASNLQVNAGAGPMGPSGGGGGSPANTAILAPVASGIQKALWAEQNSQQTQRMELTLGALQALARAVSAYSGRKNLLWLSAELAQVLRRAIWQHNRRKRDWTGASAFRINV